MCVSSILAIVFITMYMYKYLSRRKLERVYYMYVTYSCMQIFVSWVLHKMCCDANKNRYFYLFLRFCSSGGQVFVCLFLCFIALLVGCLIFDAPHIPHSPLSCMGRDFYSLCWLLTAVISICEVLSGLVYCNFSGVLQYDANWGHR